MAHMIDTMAYAGEVPWHGLGKRVLADLTPEQMLVEAGLDWVVYKHNLYFKHDGEEKAVPGRKALIRSRGAEILDVVGDDWNPLQNQDAFQFFNDFVSAGDMEMHTAGALEGGRRVWALAKVKESFEVFKEDVVDQYLLLSNPHKYGQSIDVRMTPIRVVCNNTLTFALSSHSDKMVRVNHRTAFDPASVKKTLGLAHEKLETYKEAAKFLGSKRFTADSLVDYYNRVFPTNKEPVDGVPTSRNAKIALDVIEKQPGHEFGEGTWWQAFNSVTFMTDHLMGRSADTRLTSAWFGGNHKRKIDALRIATEMAEAA